MRLFAIYLLGATIHLNKMPISQKYSYKQIFCYLSKAKKIKLSSDANWTSNRTVKYISDLMTTLDVQWIYLGFHYFKEKIRTILLIKSYEWHIILMNPILIKTEESTMSITATELKQNLSKYLLMAEQEDVFITRNGKVVAKLTNPYQDRVDMAKTLFGILPKNMTIDKAHRERIERI